jgi:hypothetical protein
LTGSKRHQHNTHTNIKKTVDYDKAIKNYFTRGRKREAGKEVKHIPVIDDA